jgi:hypothetical protein
VAKKAAPVQPRPVSRRLAARWARERRLQRLVILGVAGVLLIALGLPAYAFYREYVAMGFEPIARVEDRVLTMNGYLKLLRYRDYLLRLQAGPSTGTSSPFGDPVAMQRAILPTQVVFDWVDDQVIRRGAEKYGLSVSADEIDQAIARNFTPPQSQTGQPPANPADLLKDFLNRTGLSEAEYRDIVAGELLRQKLDAFVREQVPTTAEQVHVQALVYNKADDADQAYNRLQAGESFETLLGELPSGHGGDLGWFPRGVRDAEFDRVVFDELQPGQYSRPFATTEAPPNDLNSALNPQQKFYIVRVLERDPNRSIDPDKRAVLQDRALARWLDQHRQDFRIEYLITSEKQLWATRRLEQERSRWASASP